MTYIILFIEGTITFISPCILPMMPIYISYFLGGSLDNDNKTGALINALGFVLGFSIIFSTLGLAAGTLGVFIREYIKLFNLFAGAILIVFGLNYIGLLKISFLNQSLKLNGNTKNLNLGSCILFGIVFAIGWTPCVGTFLGSALMIASNSQNSMEGFYMLLAYSMGLGLPFIISALIIDSLKGAFNFIKANYKAINIISGCFLIIVGLLMITGYFDLLLAALTF